MPPKGKAPPPTSTPALEDEVIWPEGVTTVPDPPFFYAVTHIYGHAFKLEGVAEGDERPPLREFDPITELTTALKEESADDPVARRIITTDRDELRALAEGGSLARGLRVKAEKESAARSRRKTNSLRSKVIAAHEAAEAKAAAEKARREAAAAIAAERAAKMAEHEAAVEAANNAGNPPPEPPVFEDLPVEEVPEEEEEAPQEEPPAELVDFVLLVIGYPENSEELQELSDEDIFSVSDAWTAAYLSGESIREEEPVVEEDSEEPAVAKVIHEICRPPEILGQLYDSIQGASLDSNVASGTIFTIHDSHSFAPPAVLPEEGDTSAASLVAEVRSSILSNLSEKAAQRKAFKEWMAGVEEVKDVPDFKAVDMSHYSDLASSVDPARHDIPLLLHCMCEQVAHTLAGDQHDGHGYRDSSPIDDLEELSLMDIYLEDVHKKVIHGDLSKAHGEEVQEILGLGPGGPPDWKFPGAQQSAEADTLTLPYLDRVGCRHAGEEMSGHVSVDEVVHRILSHVNAPGIRRSGLPEAATDSTPRRCAKRNRIYALLPEAPVVVFEKLLLLNEFERLLHSVQPEREWCFKDRIFHERIPKELLVQVLLEGFNQQECFLASSYVARHDCLIVALYHRALPARMLWHGWAGDHLAPNDAEVLRTKPTFNDWCCLVAPNNASKDNGFGDVTQRPKLLGLDGRELGYCRILEKVFSPSDRSVILRTKLQRGLGSTFEALPEGCDLPPPPAASDGDEEKDEEEDELKLGVGLGDTKADDKNKTLKMDTPEDEYEPPPRYEKSSVRILKDNLMFGIIVDDEWEKMKPGFRELREAHEREVAEAAAAAAEAAAEAERIAREEAEARALAGETNPDEEDGVEATTTTLHVEEPEEEKEATSETKLEVMNLGIFWLVFPDGSRCNCRVHHERRFWPEGGFKWDLAERRPGMLFSYLPLVGLPLQIFSDGTVRQTWPPELRGPILAGNLRTHSSMLPGGPEDCELARTVTPYGTVVRELLSGRREIYHPDGTCAIRNPTLAELRLELDKFQLSHNQQSLVGSTQTKHCPAGMKEVGGPLAYLRATILAVEELHGKEEDKLPKTWLPGDDSSTLKPPSDMAKFSGIPGHWRVTRTDGSVYGRIVVPPPPPEPEIEEADENVEENGEAVTKADTDQVEEEEVENKVEDENAEEEEPPPPPPSWEEVYAEHLGGFLIEQVTHSKEGFLIEKRTVVEYPIEQVNTLNQVDPHTRQYVTTNAEGLMSFEHADGSQRVCIHADGTRQIRLQAKEANGAEKISITVEKERTARITCNANINEYDPGYMVNVECVDGTIIEVVPKYVTLKGDLGPSDPCVDDPIDASTNASVLLRRKDGTIVYSRGAGEIQVASGFDVMAKTEKEILRALDTPGLYTVFCLDGCIKMGDEDGNFFEIFRDQTVDCKLAVSMGDEYKSPRCHKPNTPYQHPHAAFLPLPEEVPDPRLFVVYGDGEAEELMITRDAEEAIRLAHLDTGHCCVSEGEKLGPPMSSCVCHTIFRTTSSDNVSIPPLNIDVPPSIAGFSSGTDAFAPAPGCSFTEFRQFMEYPSISDTLLRDFHKALAQHEEREERHRSLQASYGQGISARKFAAVAPEVPGGA